MNGISSVWLSVAAGSKKKSAEQSRSVIWPFGRMLVDPGISSLVLSKIVSAAFMILYAIIAMQSMLRINSLVQQKLAHSLSSFDCLTSVSSWTRNLT
jgi:hypothetical protein